MLIWLASYPRSGNTLMRTLLKQVFNLPTYSKHEPSDVKIRLDMKAVDAIGTKLYDGNFWEFLESSRNSNDKVIVKTHDGPDGADKAIYVVRNGIVAMESYQHYIRDFAGIEMSWDEVTDDVPPFGSWSTHLDAWSPLTRPDTLLIRYEDVVNNPSSQIASISKFIEQDQVREWRSPFEELHALEPTFFRRGEVETSSDRSQGDISLFMKKHARWMDRLGYNA